MADKACYFMFSSCTKLEYTSGTSFFHSFIWRHLKIYIKPSLILSLTCISIYYYRIMKKLCQCFQPVYLDQLSIPDSENLYISFPEFRICCKLALLTGSPLFLMNYSLFYADVYREDKLPNTKSCILCCFGSLYFTECI